MKKTKKLLILLLITAVLSAGLTLAFMFRTTGPVNNQFEPAVVMCKVVDTYDGTDKTSIEVENDSNILCYVRLRLVTYWVDKNGNTVGMPSSPLKVSVNDTYWMKGEDDTFYYRTPLEAKGKAYNLLKDKLVLEERTFNGEPVYQVVNAFAEAIQANPPQAVKEAWPGFSPSQN